MSAIAVCGHVDSGKSTLVGHLLYLLGDISKEEMAKNAAESSAMGESSMKWAWSLDKSKNEVKGGEPSSATRRISILQR